MLLAAVVIETFIVTILKQCFSQPRPPAILPDVFLAERLGWHSFPSGDTAMAFMLAWTLKQDLPRPARAAFIAYAVLIGYERMYLGAHFPLDVLGGAAAGILSVLLAERIFQRKAPAPPPEETPEEEKVPI